MNRELLEEHRQGAQVVTQCYVPNAVLGEAPRLVTLDGVLVDVANLLIGSEDEHRLKADLDTSCRVPLRAVLGCEAPRKELVRDDGKRGASLRLGYREASEDF